ncbi:MAG: 6-bladed beta-propeller [Bacteroidales bacterium]|nr:6-bladed beta-propeller [Bacteroidales bacterium]
MKKYLFFIILIFAFSCGKYPNPRAYLKTINPDSVMKVSGTLEKDCEVEQIFVPNFPSKEKFLGTIDNVFDSLFVIKLETNDNSIIGNLDQVLIVNDTIYIRDWTKTKNICLFDMQGHFINNIGKVGNGPYEYVSPTDMYVTDDAVFVFDEWQHKIIKYKHDGTPIFDKKISFICNQIFPLPNGEFLFRGIDSQNYHLKDVLDHQFWLCDTSMIIRKIGLYRKNDEFVHFWNNNIFLRNKNEAYYYNDISDTLYFIDCYGNFLPKFYFNFPRNHSKECLRNSEKFNNEYISLVSYGFVEDILLYTLLENNHQIYIFENLKTKSIKVFTTWEVTKSNISRLLHFEQMKTTYKNYVVSTFPSYGILERYNYSLKDKENWWKDAPNSLYEKDMQLVNSVSEDDNDLLVFYRLRNDL